jgi:hypothetical protein
LIAKASYVAEQLTTIVRELEGYYRPESTVTVEAVRQELRDLLNELTFALSLVPNAGTIETPTSTKTKSTPISKDTLEAIEVSALVIAQATKILAENSATDLLNKDPAQSDPEAGTEDDDDECDCHYDGGIMLCDACRLQRLNLSLKPSYRDCCGGE